MQGRSSTYRSYLVADRFGTRIGEGDMVFERKYWAGHYQIVRIAGRAVRWPLERPSRHKVLASLAMSCASISTTGPRAVRTCPSGGGAWPCNRSNALFVEAAIASDQPACSIDNQSFRLIPKAWAWQSSASPLAPMCGSTHSTNSRSG